jgi:hypothetical protein
MATIWHNYLKTNTMKNFLLWIALLGLLAWSGCKKPCEDPTDPDCVNYCFDPTDPNCDGYDPCTAETPVSAEFRIIENGSWPPLELYDTMYFDTFYTGDLITEAIHQHPDWKYQWKIGSGDYEGVSTALNYGSAGYGEAISMTLMVEGPPNTDCFPDDDGRDTVTRVVYQGSGNPSTDHLTLGMYHGYLNGNPKDTTTLGFFYYYDDNSGRLLMDMVNFYPGCSSPPWTQAGTTRKYLFTSGTSLNCASPRGLLVRDPEKIGDFDSVRIEYSISDYSTPDRDDRVNFVFQGRRQ